MNVLLWKWEIGSNKEEGIPVSLSLIWDRILTCPDPSSLILLYDNERIGLVRIIPNIIEAYPTNKTDEIVSEAIEVLEPEGRVKKIEGYSIELDGFILVEGEPSRLRFNGKVELNESKELKQVIFRCILGRQSWQIELDSIGKEIIYREQIGRHIISQRWSYDQIQRPSRWLKILLPLVAPQLHLSMQFFYNEIEKLERENTDKASINVLFTAYERWFEVKNARTRGYVIKAEPFEGRMIEMWINRIGEIVRIKIGHQFEMLNEAFFKLASYND